MRVAVYSGSFNPMHIGHLSIIRYLVERGGFDKVYLVVSPKNPLKDNISGESAGDRFDAAVEAVKRHFAGGVVVDGIELAMPEPHYTVRTLDAMREREPDNEYVFVMGADNLADIRRWKEYGRILKEYGVAVYPREGVDLESVRNDLLGEDPSYRISLIDSPLVNISSTMIREGMAAGEDMSPYLL